MLISILRNQNSFHSSPPPPPSGVTKIEKTLTPKARTCSIHPVLGGTANSPTGDDLKEWHHRQDFPPSRIWKIYLASSV